MKNNLLIKKLESTSQDYILLKSKEKYSKAQIENLETELNSLKESSKVQTCSLHKEIQSLRENLKKMIEDNEQLSENSKKMMSELNHLKYKSYSNEAMTVALEQKYSLSQNEKQRLFSLIKTIQSQIKSSHFQRIVNEILRVHSELELCQLEKLRVSMQLRTTDEITDSTILESLRKQSNSCDSNIATHSSKLKTLKAELISEKSD